ncbi:miaA [Acrasis kona]|uniref:MiaA n=1 Tax=Acrasis kona TaxID=1008807 RepID=A0AAW2YHR9_9EUKA
MKKIVIPLLVVCFAFLLYPDVLNHEVEIHSHTSHIYNYLQDPERFQRLNPCVVEVVEHRSKDKNIKNFTITEVYPGMSYFGTKAVSQGTLELTKDEKIVETINNEIGVKGVIVLTFVPALGYERTTVKTQITFSGGLLNRKFASVMTSLFQQTWLNNLKKAIENKEGK